MYEILLLVAIGLAIGFISSFLGVGGGSITVPVLYAAYPNMPPQSIVAISLSSIFIITSINSLQYYRMKLAPSRVLTIALFISCLVGATIGTKLIYIMSPDFIKRGIGILLLLITVKLFIKQSASLVERESPPTGLIGAIGFGGSLISSLTGLGGGAIFTPAFIGLARLSLKRVTAFSNVAMVFATGLGTLPHLYLPREGFTGFQTSWLNSLFVGNVNLAAAFILMVGGLITSRLGVLLNDKVEAQKKRYILAILLLILGTKTLLG